MLVMARGTLVPEVLKERHSTMHDIFIPDDGGEKEEGEKKKMYFQVKKQIKSFMKQIFTVQ